MSPNGEPGGALRVGATFELRLAAGPSGEPMWMPAQAAADTDAEGRALLNLPSATSLSKDLRVSVRTPEGRTLYEQTLSRDLLASKPELIIRLDPELPDSLSVVARGTDGRPLSRRELGVVGRREGATDFEVLLAGRADDEGRLYGPYPRGRFAEASAVVRIDGNLTVPVALQDGRLPPVLTLEVPVAGQDLPAPAPTDHGAPAPAEATSQPDLGRTDPPDDGQRRPRHRPALVALGVAMMLGIFLRIYKIGGPSLWNDELSSWRRTSYDSLGVLFEKGIVPDVHPPGYYLLLYASRALLGDSAAAMRLPSALAGIAAIAVMFLLGRRLWTEREGVIAAGLTAVLWAPIRYSQEVRAYSFMLLLSAISGYALYGALRDLDRRSQIRVERIAIYVLSATALLYFHYFGLVLVGLQCAATVIYAASRRRRRSGLGHALVMVTAPVVLYLPWLSPMLDDMSNGKAWMSAPDENTAAGFYSYLRFLLNLSTAYTVAALVLLTAAAALGLTKLRRAEGTRLRFRTPWIYCLLWLVTPFLIAWIKSVVSTPVLSNRNLLISAPALYLLLARSLTSLPLHTRIKDGLAAAFVGLGLLSFVNMNYYEKPNRQQYREAVAWVMEASKDTPTGLLIGAGTPQHWDYYLEHLGSDRHIDVGATDREISKLKERFKNKGAPKQAWLMSAGAKPDEQFVEFLEKWYHQIRVKSFFGVDVTEYRFGTTRKEETTQQSTDEAPFDPDAEAVDEDTGPAADEVAPDKKSPENKKADKKSDKKAKKKNNSTSLF